MLKPKKKSVFSLGKKKNNSVSTLSDEHLLKQLSLRYFVDQSLKLKDVARKLNVPKTVIKGFFDDQEFVEELEDRIERVHGIGTEFMQSQAKISLLHLYEEMRRREVEGELKDIPLKELHKILTDTQRELRLDTPGAFTSKVGVADLSSLQDRYNKSLSGRVHQRASKVRKLKKASSKDRLIEESSSSGKESNNNSEAGRAR